MTAGTRMERRDLDAIADRIAARLELAVVERVPHALMELLQDGSQQTQNLYTVSGFNYAQVRFGRHGDVLVFDFEANGQRVATFRFVDDSRPR